MEYLENIVMLLDTILDTPRKRHITGGVMLSLSVLFGSLALTVMTIKNEEVPEYEE